MMMIYSRYSVGGPSIMFRNIAGFTLAEVIYAGGGFRPCAVLEYGLDSRPPVVLYRVRGHEAGHRLFTARKKRGLFPNLTLMEKVTLGHHVELQAVADKWFVRYATQVVDERLTRG